MNREVSSKRVLMVGLAVALCLLPAAFAKDTGVRFERDVACSKYQTYDWVDPVAKPEGSPLAVGGEIDTAIRNAVDRQLRKQGFEEATDGEADFLVSFDGAMESVTDFDGLRRDVTPGVAWVMEGTVNSYNRGTLIISVRDGESEKIVWSAWTTEKVKNPEHGEKQVDKAVRKLLRKFPPK